MNSQLSNPLDMSITAYKVERGSGTPDSNTRIRHLGWRKLCGLPCRLIRVGVGHEIPLALLTRFWDTGYHNVLLLMARRVGSGTPNYDTWIRRPGRGGWNGPLHRLIRVCVGHLVSPALLTRFWDTGYHNVAPLMGWRVGGSLVVLGLVALLAQDSRTVRPLSNRVGV